MQMDPVTVRQILAAAVTGVLPVKYAYLGRGADIHDSYSQTEHYAASNGRSNLDGIFLERFRPQGRPSFQRIVDIGPGNGRRSANLLESLSQFEIDIRRYDGIENSTRLAEIARTELARVLADERVHFLIGDVEQANAFEDISARLGWRNEPVLALILGNTLGNVASPENVLSRLGESLAPESLVYFTLAASSELDSETVERLYGSDLFKSGIVSGLVHAGVPPESLRITISCEQAPFPCAVGTAILNDDVKLRVAEDNFVLPRGHQIRCFQSRRFDAQDIDDLMRAANLELIGRQMEQTEGVWRCLAIR